MAADGTPIGFFQGLEAIDPVMDRARAVAAKFAGTTLEPIAQAFLSNADTAFLVLGVPVACVSAGYFKAMDEVLQAMEAGLVGPMLESLPPNIQGLAANALMGVVGHKQGQLIARTREVLETIQATDPAVATTFQALARAAITQTWTGFECVATDCWVAALNADPRLGQSALVAPAPATTPEGLSNKAISVGLLGKFGFDLRNRMGTVLREKFHFGKVAGVRQAFAAAFGRKAAVLAVFEDRALLQLEATRHVIVHRGGIVDEDYRRVSGSSEPVGAALKFSGTQIAPLMTAGAAASCAVLEFVASLADTPQ